MKVEMRAAASRNREDKHLCPSSRVQKLRSPDAPELLLRLIACKKARHQDFSTVDARWSAQKAQTPIHPPGAFLPLRVVCEVDSLLPARLWSTTSTLARGASWQDTPALVTSLLVASSSSSLALAHRHMFSPSMRFASGALGVRHPQTCISGRTMWSVA